MIRVLYSPAHLKQFIGADEASPTMTSLYSESNVFNTAGVGDYLPGGHILVEVLVHAVMKIEVFEVLEVG